MLEFLELRHQMFANHLRAQYALHSMPDNKTACRDILIQASAARLRLRKVQRNCRRNRRELCKPSQEHDVPDLVVHCWRFPANHQDMDRVRHTMVPSLLRRLPLHLSTRRGVVGNGTVSERHSLHSLDEITSQDEITHCNTRYCCFISLRLYQLHGMFPCSRAGA